MPLLAGSIAVQSTRINLTKTDTTRMATAQDNSTPSFVTGLGLGLLAGAAGFVLFGTKRGSAIRHELKQVFAEAYQEEIAAGEITGEAISLRDFLTTAFAKVKAELDLDTEAAKKIAAGQNKNKSKTKSTKTKASAAKTKFKNT